MNGITILNTIEIYQIAWWQTLLALLPLVISACICFIRLHNAYKKGTIEEQERYIINGDYWDPREFIIILVGGFLSIILSIYFANVCPADHVESRYEIQIDNSASFNEVWNKYELIEEKENTFIVAERED